MEELRWFALSQDTEKYRPSIGRVLPSHAYDLGCRKFIAGGALGFDTEAAREVIRFRISHPDVHLALYLPCIGQDISWSDRQRALYDYTLNCANEVRYVSENYDSDCMRRRNYAMVIQFSHTPWQRSAIY